MRKVILLGSTGSIGTQALAVISQFPREFQVLALGAGGANLALLAAQACEFRVGIVGIADTQKVAEFKEIWLANYSPLPVPEILSGPNAMTDLAAVGGKTDANTVVLNGITGSIGLAPTLAALASGATLALANKESLVAGGALVAQAMCRPGQIVPVDSEHCAIYQALAAGKHHRGLTTPFVDGTTEVRRLILTASGGPFYQKTKAELDNVTPAQALNHPTWDMGPVVTINSSTLMNKALELIEAAILFDMPATDIVPVVHRQSIVHSMVEFQDGSTIAQASMPDMKLPIALGLSAPIRLPDITVSCSWDKEVIWTFAPVDHETFPALTLAKVALESSPLHPAVFNAANEEAVTAFLQEKIKYLAIMEIVEQTLSAFDTLETGISISLAAVEEAQVWARNYAQELIAAL